MKTPSGKSRNGITKRGRDSFLVRVFLGRDETGKVRYHNHTVRGTRRDAEAYRDEIRAQFRSGVRVEPSRQTLAEYLRKWLEAIEGTVSPKTFSDYRSLANRHIIPALGHRRISELQAAEIQAHYNRLRSSLSARTVHYVHAVLNSALSKAVRWDELARNPAKLVDLPKRERREMRALDADEVNRLLDAAEGTRFSALWHLLVVTGIRPGEALGLRWSDIDGNKLRVQRALAQTAKGPQLSETKTSLSRRVIPLSPKTLEVLKHHRRTQAAERLAAKSFAEMDLVFCTSEGRPLEWRVIARRHFKPLIARAGIDGLRPYDLRHTHATLLLRENMHPKIVSERLGHASTKMTLDVYSHVTPNMQDEATTVIENVLFKKQA